MSQSAAQPRTKQRTCITATDHGNDSTLTVIRATFDGSGAFAACNAAEQFLEDMGYSVGPTQGKAPRGILKGDIDIMKWRNLSAAEVVALHGTMTGDMRNGPVHINISHPVSVSA